MISLEPIVSSHQRIFNFDFFTHRIHLLPTVSTETALPQGEKHPGLVSYGSDSADEAGDCAVGSLVIGVTNPKKKLKESSAEESHISDLEVSTTLETLGKIAKRDVMTEICSPKRQD